MKTRVLWVGEATYLKTGYSVYGHELLSRLHQIPQLEIAELACYAAPEDPRINQVPWKLYPNLPRMDDPKGQQTYNNGNNASGAWLFNDILLDFKPHVVLDIRDVFMFDYEDTSPLREYFSHLIMPTVDSAPQNRQWLDIIARANGVFTYQDWSKDVIKRESGNRINIIDSAPSAADEAFRPLDKAAIKASLGLSDYKIIGTVMRNQPRKSFPELFQAFRQYLDESRRSDVLLYCHTSYPDAGWDFPTLLSEYGLHSKVLFTYTCNNCHSAFASYFSSNLRVCDNCHQAAAEPCNVQVGLDNAGLATIYNLFDVYVQYVSNEGFGMPQLEAAACGVPVLGTDYSAMEDIVRKLAGEPIRVLTKFVDIYTGCYRAIPDNQHFVELLHKVFSLSPEQLSSWGDLTRKQYEKYYSWDETANKWANAILKVNAEYYEQMWNRPAQVRSIPQPNYDMSNKDFAKWLMTDLLGDPTRLNSLMHVRLEKDLNMRCTTNITNGMYFNEMSNLFARPQKTKFDKETAYNHFKDLRERKNEWERRRSTGHR